MTAIDWLTEPWTSELVLRGSLTAALAGSAAAAVGCWVALRDLPYAAESLSHGMFPGIIAATLLGLPIALGGLGGLLLAVIAIALAARFAPGGDAATAVAITPLVGVGALLAFAGPIPPGAGTALFGDVLATTTTDLWIAVAAAIVVAATLTFGYWRLLAAGVLPGSGRSADLAVLVTLAIAISAAAGSLGALLAVAFVIGPADAAQRLTRRASRMIPLAVGVCLASVVAGIEIAWHADLAAGPTIAICAIIPSALLACAKLIRTAPNLLGSNR
jgi:ABC-type Mn2+/Zn2+ transport system permease subunit